MNRKYPYKEHLKKKSDIKYLFDKGKWVKSDFLSMVFVDSKQENVTKVGVSVSKKLFKRAVDRNRLKRLIRECYRLNKEDFKNSLNNNFVMIIYNQKEIVSFEVLERDFILLLGRLS